MIGPSTATCFKNLIVTGLTTIVTSLALGQDPAAPELDAMDFPRITRDLKFQTGEVSIAGDKVKVVVPPGFSFLDAADARHVVEDFWGNPANPSTLGLFVPGGKETIEQGSYAVVVSLEEEGYVDDDDAKELDFADMLSSMQDDTAAGSKVRAKQGFPKVELLGWAEPPHYDASAKKLYWAKRLRFGGEPGETLNYDVRVLGRKGALVYSAVGSVDELQSVSIGCKALLAATEFTAGNRYEDFDSSVDEIAAYGIGGLIAGKVLAKVGIFALLAKSWKLVALALVAIATIVKKFLSRGTAPSA